MVRTNSGLIPGDKAGLKRSKLSPDPGRCLTKILPEKEDFFDQNTLLNVLIASEMILLKWEFMPRVRCLLNNLHRVFSSL